MPVSTVSIPNAFVRATLALVVLAASPPAVGQVAPPDAKWVPADALADESFGAAVALDGAVAVVGALRDNDSVFNAGEYGAAYVYTYDGVAWDEAAKLTAPERSFFDWFGWSVAVSGDAVLVGAYKGAGVTDGAGTTYVFRQRGASWEQEAQLAASDGAPGDFFSSALALEGDVALVGAPSRNGSGFDQGAAYVFRRDEAGWTEEAMLTPSIPEDASYFGYAVALSGPRALIGAWGADENEGAVYVFEHDGSGWVETARFAPDTPERNAQFGESVALDGDVALVGASLDEELGPGAGAAYVFRYDGSQWRQEAKLLAPEYSGFDTLGGSVAVEGERALVGAQNDAPTGRALLFAYDAATGTWPLERELAPDDGAGGDRYGLSVALDDGVFLVGSPDHDQPVTDTGAAYVYGTPAEVFEVAAEEGGRERPGVGPLTLAPPAPNPFRSRTRTTLTLAAPGAATVAVYDLLGRRVALLHEGPAPAGAPLDLTWEAAGAPAGVYVVRAVTASGTAVRRIVRTR